MDKLSIKHVIEKLKIVQANYQLYFESSLSGVVNFIYGFNVASEVFGAFEDVDPIKFYEDAVTKRGWSWSSTAPLPEMKKRRLSDEAIIQELLAIELDKWEAIYKYPDSK